jgi:aldose 1-epimerase
LAYQRFRWQDRDYSTAPNFDDNPHSVHGVGWLRAWEVVAYHEANAVLHYRHVPDAHWPFAFEAQQTFALTPHSLAVTLAVTNTADIAQPIGLGWHPYFPKRERSQLRITVSDRWDSDESQLPVRKVAQADIDDEVSDLRFDNCFEGWRGPAGIRDEMFSMQLSSNLTHLVIYTPADKAYFCVEPVSHVSDAIHSDEPAALGLRTLQPGERFEASMTLDIAVL